MIRSKCIVAGFVVILAIFLMTPVKANSAFLYKSYTIRSDRGWDILCDPYVVQKNDWVLKLFKQKGEISHEDFPEFLRIFKRINPHIRDIDRIRPGQHIMIPLRKMKQGTLPGQSSGIVTIPFVTISNIPETLKKHSAAYEVRQGDCVSILIARKFGGYGTAAYQDGVKLFKLMNPDIEDLNRIYTGQMVHLPDPTIRRQPWYPSLFDQPLRDSGGQEGDNKIPAETLAQTSLPTQSDEETARSPLAAAASVVGAKLFDRGRYFLPRPGQDDFEFDLSRMPLMEQKDGTRILFPQDYQNREHEINVIESFWHNVKIVRLAPDASAEQIFDAVFKSTDTKLLAHPLSFKDHGIEVETRGKWVVDERSGTGKTDRKICISLVDSLKQRTPVSILRYLEQHGIVVKDIFVGKDEAALQDEPAGHDFIETVDTFDPLDHRALVSDLLSIIGYQYAPNVSITFPYADIQVKAVSNLVTKPNGSPLLVDFGDFYGDAISAIQKTGFDIIQVKNQDSYKSIIKKLLGALGLSYTNNPTFLAAERAADYNTALTIPGFMVGEAAGRKVLFSEAPLHAEIIQLLKRQGVTVVKLEQPGKYL